MTNQLMVFLKRPEAGFVKTRLAASIGETQALEVYDWLVDATRETFKNTNAKIQLYFDKSNGKLPEWVSEYATYFQKGNDLGERMAFAFQDRFNIDPSSKLVLIGSDCPDLSADVLNEAFDFLQENDVVLGPAADGGVYLIGLNLWNDSLFQGVKWSTNSVFGSLIENARQLDLSCETLEELKDIDVLDDFLEYEDRFNTYKSKKHVTSS